MPTPNERKALGFLVLLALSGSAVRVWRARGPDPPPAATRALELQLGRAESARAAARRPGPRPARAPTRAAMPAGPVDVDRAGASELEALPGIGPSLAARIVAHRDSAGPFGSLDALCEVRGIGPALAARLRPLVTFSAFPRPVSATCGGGSKSSRKPRGARPAEWR